MRQSLSFDLLSNGSRLAGDGKRQRPDSVDKLGIVQAQLCCKPLPVPQPDVAQAVFPADSHGKFHFTEIHLTIWKDARQIVQRCESHDCVLAQEKRVVFRVGIRSRDEPIEREGVYECLNILIWAAGLIPEQFHDSSYPRSTVAFILARGVKAESLAH